MQALKVLRKKLRASRRRWIQGDNQKDDDSEFEQTYQQYLGIESALKQFQEHVSSYCKALQKSCEFQSKIAGDLLYFFSTASAHRGKVQAYLATCRNLSASCSESCNALEENVIKPVGIHIELFPVIKKIVKKRHNKRIDLNAYRRQLESTKRTNTKYQRKLQKMQRASVIFDKINNDLISVFQAYIEFREQMLDHYIHYVIEMQIDFYSTAATKTKDMQDVITTFKEMATSMPAEMEAKVQEIVKGVELFEENLASGAITPSPVSSPLDLKTKPGEEPKVLQNYDNPKFDTSISFENRHRLAAPSEQAYSNTKKNNFEIAIYGYKARQSDELSFVPGESIEVLEIKEGGWWMGSLHGQSGLFPCNYTQPLIVL